MKPNDKRALIEVCCADIESVRAAIAGGADRIELCSSLETGGLTPSLGLIAKAIDEFSGPVNVLIRPRSGDFIYSDAELDVIEDDINIAKDNGATGIVFGALTPEGEIDVRVMKRMIQAARPCSFTLHRAFDMVRDPIQALETAKKLGVDRILTSGCAPSAKEGIPTLKKLVENAAGKVIILAGAGVKAENALEIVGQTGVKELHGSCKTRVKSKMLSQRSDVSMGGADADEYSVYRTSEGAVKELVKAVCK